MKNVAMLMLMLMALPVGALTLIVTLSAAAYSQGETRFSRWVDGQGNIELPPDVRSGWVHLGSWSVGVGSGDGSFHDVYTERESFAYFREHQEFPDGATLVKEVRSIRSAEMTTGEAQWAGEPKVWFVMIKDGAGRLDGNPLWGDGWGWALFDASNPKSTVTTDYARECRSCHVPAQPTDWVYVQGYPTLGVASKREIPATVTPIAGRSEAPSEGPVVAIRNLSFEPQVIRVRRGQTVTWINHDDFVHTATADDGSFDTEAMAPRESIQIVFDDTGTFSYHCSPHPFMTGSVIVEE